MHLDIAQVEERALIDRDLGFDDWPLGTLSSLSARLVSLTEMPSTVMVTVAL